MKGGEQMDILWLMVLLLVTGWIIGMLGFAEVVGTFVHLLLILAILMILLRLMRGR